MSLLPASLHPCIPASLAPRPSPRAPRPAPLALPASHAAAAAAVGLNPRDLAGALRLIRATRYQQAIDALLYAEDIYQESDQQAAHFLLGKLLVQAGDPSALGWLQKLPAPFRPVDDLRLAYTARAYLLADNKAQALVTIEDLLSAHPKSKERYALRVEAARIIAEQGELNEALAHLDRNRKSGTAVPRAVRAETLRAKVDILLPTAPKKAKEEARKKLASIHAKYPLTYYDILGYQMEAKWEPTMPPTPARRQTGPPHGVMSPTGWRSTPPCEAGALAAPPSSRPHKTADSNDVFLSRVRVIMLPVNRVLGAQTTQQEHLR